MPAIACRAIGMRVVTSCVETWPVISQLKHGPVIYIGGRAACAGGGVMAQMPPEVVDVLNAALVSELTVFDAEGRMHTDPLIPMWDGQHILMTSSVLFSAKLE